MRKLPLHLARLTTEEARAIVDGPATPVILLPVGSTEPHGPHLPLSTDVTISEEACRRAARSLRGDHDVAAFIAPAVPYGVTDFAEGFAGAVSLPAEMVQRLAAELCRAFLRDGWHHVSVVNNHLEPEHVAALHAAAVEVNEAGGGAESTGGRVPVSFPNVLSRRWGATLTEEFKSGACHAGCYESSLILAADPDAVRREIMKGLEPDPTSISEGIRAGKRSFRELGSEKGYFGDPAASTAEEGDATYEKLRLMVVTEVLEALGRG